MKICPSCALSNADDAVFCIRCGATIGAPPAAGPPGGTVPGAPATGAALGAPPRGPLDPGSIVDGKYRIERVLGEGGMGVVYLARDIHTDTFVVVKSIRAEYAHDPEFRARTLAEGRAIARIDHPNVVHFNAVVVERGALYLIMQFIEGEPLDGTIARHVAAHAPIPLAEVLRVFRMILEGVAAAHREGVIHRDLKPANILVRAKDGVVKVTDFGIAKGEEDAKAGRGQTKGIIGSLWYMAPEQVRGQRDLDKRVDVYALGILLFEMLTGRVPFDAPSDYEVMKLHTEAPLPSVHRMRPDVPPAIDEVLARACAKSREDRYPSCEAFLADLDRHAAAPAVFTAGSLPVSPVAFTAPAPRSLLDFPATTAPNVPPAAPPRGSLTHDGAALAAEPARPSRVGLYAGIGVAVLVATGGVGLFASGVLSGGGGSHGHRGDAGTRPRDAAPPDAPPEAAPASPLAALVGPWKSETGRDYDAVLSGDVLEFRIHDAGQLERQGYKDGEARFALAAIAGDERSFTVEDKLRPEPPKGVEYDAARARTSCQEVWSSVAGKPLRAQFDGKRLTVDIAKIEPTPSMFQVERGKVVGCVKLRDAVAAKIESVLVRP